MRSNHKLSSDFSIAEIVLRSPCSATPDGLWLHHDCGALFTEVIKSRAAEKKHFVPESVSDCKCASCVRQFLIRRFNVRHAIARGSQPIESSLRSIIFKTGLYAVRLHRDEPAARWLPAPQQSGLIRNIGDRCSGGEFSAHVRRRQSSRGFRVLQRADCGRSARKLAMP